MRIDEMPALVHDWPEHARLTEGDSEQTVTVVPGMPYTRQPDETVPVRTPRMSSDGPARLIHRNNAVDNHQQRVDGLLTALKTADDFLSVPKTGARDWAADLRYGDPIIEYINGAVALIHKALDLIDMNENG